MCQYGYNMALKRGISLLLLSGFVLLETVECCEILEVVTFRCELHAAMLGAIFSEFSCVQRTRVPMRCGPDDACCSKHPIQTTSCSWIPIASSTVLI